MCFWGNVPASLLCTGRPEQIKDDVRELIDIFGHDGRLIADSGSGIPDDVKPENVWAMTGAVWEYSDRKREKIRRRNAAIARF
jgi:uroporphyrinogen-III decarboxylase